MMHKSILLGLIFALGTASAQTRVVSQVTEKEEIKKTDAKVLGWQKKLVVGAGVSLGTSDNVVGQQSGSTNTFSATVEGQLNHIKERDEWRNTLKLSESTSRTPAIPRYVKVNDVLDLETLYLYSLESVPWFGPYAKASAQAPIFFGQDIRATDTTYDITYQNGSTQSVTGNSLRLTDGFRPLTTKESVGGFAKLMTRENLKIEGRAGLGGLQVQADRQLVLADDKDTPNVEVNELRSYSQLGAELGFSIKGKIDEKTSYSLEGEVLLPFTVDKAPGDTRDNLRLTNWDLKGRLSSKLYDWLSLDYSARALMQPQLVEELQVQTLLQLTMTYQAL